MVYLSIYFQDYNTAAQIVTRTTKFDRMTPILKKSSTGFLSSRYGLQTLLLVYKAISGTVPCHISDFLDYRISKRDTKVLFSIPSGDPESEIKDLWRENVRCGGTRTMELDPTRNKI